MQAKKMTQHTSLYVFIAITYNCCKNEKKKTMKKRKVKVSVAARQRWEGKG